MKKFLIGLLSVLVAASLFSACNSGTPSSSSSHSSIDITAEESSSDSLGDSSSESSESSSVESSMDSNDESASESTDNSAADSSNDSSNESSSADSSEDDNPDALFTTWTKSFTKGGETKEYTIKWYENDTDGIYGVGYVNGVKDGLIWTYTSNNGTDTPIVKNWSRIESDNTDKKYFFVEKGPTAYDEYWVPNNKQN